MNEVVNHAVSVIIPLYGSARHLITAVCSAAQQEQVTEVLLIDDGSLTHTRAECTRLAESFSKVRICRHPQDRVEMSTLLNFGVTQTTNEYLSFLGPDGYFLPGRFHTAVGILNAKPEVDGICVDVIRRFADKPHLQDHAPRLALDLSCERFFDQLLGGNRGDVDWFGVLLRKAALSRAGGFAPGADAAGTWDVTLIKLAILCNLQVGDCGQPMAVRCAYEHDRQTSDVVILSRLIYWAESEQIANHYRNKLLAAYLNVLPKHGDTTKPHLSFLASLVETATRWPSVMGMGTFWRCVGKTLTSFFTTAPIAHKNQKHGAAL